MASNDNDDKKQHKMTPTEQAIVEMLKQNVNLREVGPARAAAQQDGSRNEPKSHAFWDTQPMPHGDEDHPEGPIVADRPKEELRADPYTMPSEYTWCTVDVTDEKERMDLYQLLANNYVEDDDCLFRFDYSSDFLLWALTPPGWSKDLLLGVRSKTKNKLLAFISGVPARVRVYDREVNVAEINFLCVHKRLRSKRLAPVLIKEITRRVNHTGVFQAVYTAGVKLPVPVAQTRYHHRSLNPKKLVEVGFSSMRKNMTMARMQKLYKLPAQPVLQNLRPMAAKDVPKVHELLAEYLKKFQLTIMFTKDEIGHWLLPRDGVVNSYVLVNEEDLPTDLCSFYHLPSSILGHDDTLFAAYSFYNVANTVSWQQLMGDCLILAKQIGADVFNALDLMDNEEFLQDLKFGYGDGYLQYYLYNWSCPTMKNQNVGIVLL